MTEGPPRVQLGRHGRLALAGWLGAIVVVVGLAVVGPAAEPSPTSSPGAGGSALELTGPAAGTTFLGNGLVFAGARITPADRPLTFEVVVAGRVIGSIDANLDSQGGALVMIPVLPPLEGGPATVVVRDRADPRARASVDIHVGKADPVIVWLPLPDREPAVTEPGLHVIGHARPPVAILALEARDSAGGRRSAVRAPIGRYARPGDPPPWTAFEVTLPAIELPADGCTWLQVTGLTADGATVSTLEVPSATCR